MENLDKTLELILDHLAANVAERIRAAGSPRAKRLLTLEQAAEYTGLSEQAIRIKVSAGKMPVVRLDRRFRFDIQDLDNWIDVNKQTER